MIICVVGKDGITEVSEIVKILSVNKKYIDKRSTLLLIALLSSMAINLLVGYVIIVRLSYVTNLLHSDEVVTPEKEIVVKYEIGVEDYSLTQTKLLNGYECRYYRKGEHSEEQKYYTVCNKIKDK